MKVKFPTITDIYVDRVHRNAGFSMREDHVHPYFEIYYVCEGKCSFFLNDTLYALSSGDFMLIAPGDLHHTLYLPDEDCDRITLHFSEGHFLPVLLSYFPDFNQAILQSGPIVLRPEGEEPAFSILHHMLSECSRHDPYGSLMLHSYLYQLFCVLLRYRMENVGGLEISAGKDKEVIQAAKYIYQNFASPLTLAEVAAVAGLSPTYFSKKFKQVIGLGFKEYVGFVRMKNAASDLLNTKRSVTDIALDNGFADGNYFKDSFKKTYGCSPREYRKKAGDNKK